ncbi:heme NO-binding domain-containing protein [Tropicibacter oceani]|uniref:Heme NO-binding domain-containing protein n=1 Tax=Tropicibacter oceani TaxID=3058420 RepID=A0ABY8QM38_9RHOB|nr:heme NO-binding domain-containing protein [Tropicibacter oceani]WGW05677.1 heme NO-binding domain-containing protein [Tropicibacter oceani]
MKGLVFTELLEMAESALGEEVVDEVLDGLELEGGGAYSAVGSYPCSELFGIVGALSARTGISGDELQRQFGHWMFGRFSVNYPGFFEGKANALEMLDAIESEVHVEVRKLYPDAELPTFATTWRNDRELLLNYSSSRPLVAFCHGLIEACLVHFGHPGQLRQSRQLEGEGHAATFLIKLDA